MEKYVLTIILILIGLGGCTQAKYAGQSSDGEILFYTIQDQFSVSVPSSWSNEIPQNIITSGIVAKFASPDSLSKITIRIDESNFNNQAEYIQMASELLSELELPYTSPSEEETLLSYEKLTLPSGIIVIASHYNGISLNEELEWESISINEKGKRYEINYVSRPETYLRDHAAARKVINSFTFSI